MNEDELLYQLSIMLIPGVGSQNSKKFLSHCGGASQVFKEKANTLAKIDGIGEIIARSIRHFSNFKEAEDEWARLKKGPMGTVLEDNDDMEQD